MQVGDLVRALIIEGQPVGVITQVEQSERWRALYYVWAANTGQVGSFPYREHQLEVISASR